MSEITGILNKEKEENKRIKEAVWKLTTQQSASLEELIEIVTDHTEGKQKMEVLARLRNYHDALTYLKGYCS
jgi:hypothetical protein